MDEVKDKEIIPIPIEEEMKRSYLDYAMSVIVSRALPDIRDGLKPVHRRILYSMYESGNHSDKGYRKCSSVVGNVMKDYHPHGDSSIYDALVRLAQPFNLRLPLVDGQGNFGSIDGDPPAAHRYTESRLDKSAHELLEDINYNTVDFQPNYSNTTKEPIVLPAGFPNLLVNGAAGIAVGMATSVPTHNLNEVIDAICALVDNPDLTLEEIVEIIPGPDFPTGGVILGKRGIINAYRAGRGGIVVRGIHHIEAKKNRESIVITEIPYQINKAKMVERIAMCVKEKIIEGISDLRDESNRKGMRIVIELKRDAVSDVIVNQLYRHTQLQSTFNMNLLALHNGRPNRFGLKDILEIFIEFRQEVIIRRTKYRLEKAREKTQALLGFAAAISDIDEVIKIIKSSSNRTEAKERLVAKEFSSVEIMPFLKMLGEDSDAKTYYISEDQANSILDLRLHRLTALEIQKINDELKELCDKISYCIFLLGSPEEILRVIKEELLDIKRKFSQKRMTQIEEGSSEVDLESLIQSEDMVITVSLGGYIKRVALSIYKSQKRGGKGRSGMATKEEDVVNDIFVANTHDNILFFSTFGRVYRLKVYDLPESSIQSRGRALVNLLPFDSLEKISTVLVLPKDLNGDSALMFATSFGNVRRNRLKDFSYIPSNGKKAIGLSEGEQLIGVSLCFENDQVLLSTKLGVCNRFNVTDVRVFAGRESNGVRGIKLQNEDAVIAMAILGKGNAEASKRQAYLSMKRLVNGESSEENDNSEDNSNEDSNEDFEEISNETEEKLSDQEFKEMEIQEEFILTVTENGFGKRTSSYEYRTTKRGSRGFVSMVLSIKNGREVVASFPVKGSDHVILVTNHGQLIRCPVEDVRIIGRRTKGVTLFRVSKGEKVVAVSRVPEVKVNGEISDTNEEVDI